VAMALPGGAASLEDRGSGQLVVTLAWTETGGSTRALRWGIAPRRHGANKASAWSRCWWRWRSAWR
jgi:hypothetical protein